MTMDATIAGLIGALVGAIIGLVGTILAGRKQSQLEHQKWLRTREDKAIKDLQLAVSELARKLAAGVHAMQWFTWTASVHPDKLTVEQLEEKLQAYNQEVHTLFPELTGCLMVIAALNREVYARVRPLVGDFMKLDSQIATAASGRDESFSGSVVALAACYSSASRYFDSLLESVSAIVDMSAERNIEIARIFHEGWNDPDPERGAAVIADDCQFVDVPRSEKLIGPDGYRRDYHRWRTAFPDGRVEIVNVIAAGDDVVVEFVNRGTNTGPISMAQGDFPATNRPIEVPYCSVMRIQGGKVVSGRDYYDVYTILRQLGLIT